MCKETGDLEGFGVYEKNLLLIESQGAREHDKIEHGEYISQSGEVSSDITSLDDGVYSYELYSTGDVPAEAKALHEEARTKGQAGDYEVALTLFTKAIAIAPDWPYPHYDMAFAYLLKGDSASALSKYQEVDSLKSRPRLLTNVYYDYILLLWIYIK